MIQPPPVVRTANRRQFLYLAAGTGGAMSAGLVHWLLRSSRGDVEGSSPTASALQSATRTSWALGSEASITALHADRTTAAKAVDAAFAELELVESLMSIYRPESQMCRLNCQGELARPHPYLVEVLRAAREMSRRSSGAFDITVQPLWALFAQAKKSDTLPDEAQLETARQRVDWRRVEISTAQIRLRGQGTAITLNGIAQGFAADKAAAALAARGVAHALINTGELGALGRKENGQAWTVGIQHPRRPQAYVSLARLAGRCLATSGDYATAFSDDFRCHHLFDPRTGRSPDELASVSVAAPTALAADALSTAVFVLGPAAGEKLIRATPGADALLVLKDGRTLATKGFPLEA